MELEPERTQIEFLLLANHAESVNGLLYLAGAGWTEHNRPMPPVGSPPPSHIGVAVGVRVPWDETNKPIELILEIEPTSGGTKLAQLSGQINVGRPPNLALGTDQHAMIAVSAEVIFPAAGEYRVVARLAEGLHDKSWVFRVHDIPVPGMPPTTGPASG